MDTKVLTNLTKGRIPLHIQKSSPEILLGLGIVGIIGAGVLVAKGTLEGQYYFMEHQLHKSAMNTLKDEMKGEYTDEQFRRDKIVLYSRFILNMARAYGPAVAVGALSIAMIIGSNRILNTRNTGLMSAYALLDSAYKSYRKRVKGELGEDVDRYFSLDKRYEGELKVVEANKKAAPFDFESADLIGEIHDNEIDRLGMPSPHAIRFTSENAQWRPDPGQTQYFFEGQQRFMNDRLQMRGHLMLHEVYDSLGIPRTPASMVVGWLADGDYDGYVDFDIFNPYNTKDGVNLSGNNEDYILDFNVDGVVFDKI